MARNRSVSRIWILIGMLVAVAVVISAAVAFQSWWTSRPGTAPADIELTVSAGGVETPVPPYEVCLPGQACSTAKPVTVTVSDDQTITLGIHPEVADHDWSMLKIFDDPAANDETYFTGGETEEVEVAPTVEVDGGQSRLVVIEVQSLLIATGDDGTETPAQVVWSIAVD